MDRIPADKRLKGAKHGKSNALSFGDGSTVKITDEGAT